MKNKRGKELWMLIKRGFVLFFIFLVIGSFVVSLAYSPWSTRREIQGFRIVKVKNEIYTYEPNTPFYYLYSEMKKNMSDSLKKEFDPAQLNRYVVTRSVDIMIKSASVYQFAGEIGLKASQDALRRNIEFITRSPLYRAPDRGLLDFAAMQYDLGAMEGNNGDILNVTSLPTFAELYSFNEMENYTHSAEFLYLDVTNFIASSLTADDIKDYYDNNFGKYIKEVTISELSTTSKLTAFNICHDALSDGWEKTVEMYKGKVNYINSEKISDAHGSVTRFNAALKMKKGGISQKPVFENREYHIIMLNDYQAYGELKPENRKMVEIDLINDKYNDLRTKYDSAIKNAVTKAEDFLKTSQDFKSASKVSGLLYIYSEKVSPLNPVLTDEKGEQILPILDNNDISDFIFSAKPLSVSRTFYTDGYIVIAKVLKKASHVKFDYKDLAKIFPSVRKYRSYVSIDDWSKSIEIRYPHTIYEDDIKNLQQFLKSE